MRRVRVLALLEPSRAGRAVIEAAAELTADDVTFVAVAPQATGPRCGVSIGDYNAAVVESVISDLEHAVAELTAGGGHACAQLIVEGHDPPLERFAASGNFDLILLPARHSLRAGHHPAAGRLRAVSTAEVRVLGGHRRGVTPGTSAV
ncbi:MAG: hypothetical protein WBQ18_15420 [Solirubrobacteraceae bacterium]